MVSHKADPKWGSGLFGGKRWKEGEKQNEEWLEEIWDEWKYRKNRDDGGDDDGKDDDDDNKKNKSSSEKNGKSQDSQTSYPSSSQPNPKPIGNNDGGHPPITETGTPKPPTLTSNSLGDQTTSNTLTITNTSSIATLTATSNAPETPYHSQKGVPDATTSQATAYTPQASPSTPQVSASTAQTGTSHSTSSSPYMAAALPAYAIVLIVISGLMGIAFLAALVIFGTRERRRREDGLGDQPNYPRAAGRALAVATGLFVPIWAARKIRALRQKRGPEDEQQQRDRAFFDKVTAYAKLEEEGRQLQDVANVSDVRDARDIGSIRSSNVAGYLDVKEMRGGGGGAALSPTAPLNRSASLVSSLSSESEGSLGRYERLDRLPSPMTEVAAYTPYSWRPPNLPDPRIGGSGG